MDGADRYHARIRGVIVGIFDLGRLASLDGSVPQMLATTSPAPYIPAMFDAIRAELTSAGDKLAHLRRFL